MAIVERPTAPLELAPGAAVTARPLGVFTRPQGTTGWRSWLTTVDHKRIGVMYGASALLFFFLGGVEALAIRAQLAAPGQELYSADLYNQLFTMHGVTMIFLAVGLMLNTSWFLGGGADGGWFAYAPNTGVTFSPSHGMDFYAIGLQITGIASLVGGVNLVVTVLNLRAPGMTLMRMPVFTWMSFVTQILLVFAMPVISVALFLLTFDRIFDANFFNVSAGADPLLWEHLFWIFGHPEVYILILPAFGIVSEIIPVFSRKPIFGYPFMVFSGIAIGFMGWGVWAHHMFSSGLGPISVAAFSLSTMFIAVPTGVKILNWLATMWGGKLRFTTPMLFAIGLVTMFTIGGLSGVTHAVAPADTQQTDTYYIVAHFHYVIFGGALFAFFGGFYFWWPKMFGFMLSEKLGKWHFWTLFVAFNLTFGPMHILGLQGMPRRMHTYVDGYGFNFWNLVATIGAFSIAVSLLIFTWNVVASYRRHRKNPVNPGPDPWDARSLEWSIQSPSPAHNFDVVPTVSRLDEHWHHKYQEDENGRVRRVATGAEVAQPGDGTGAHLPSPSYWPIVLALGLPIIGYGLIFNLGVAALGGVLVVLAGFAWGFEPADDPEAAHAHGHDHDGQGDHDGDHGEPAEVTVGATTTTTEAGTDG